MQHQIKWLCCKGGESAQLRANCVILSVSPIDILEKIMCTPCDYVNKHLYVFAQLIPV
jgi:hypothetical protein